MLWLHIMIMDNEANVFKCNNNFTSGIVTFESFSIYKPLVITVILQHTENFSPAKPI